MGRNHDRRPRHRLVRAKGARLRLADTAARESNATRTVPDERLVLGGRWPQDHASLERWALVVRSEEEHARARRRSKDHGEALDDAPQDDGETREHVAWRPQDDGAPKELVRVSAPFDREAWYASLDRKAPHTAQLDPQEALTD